MLVDEKQCFASTLGSSGSSSYSVNVILGVIWWIKLNNPVNIWKIETPLRNICAQKNSAFRLAKFEIRGCPLLLLLLPMNVLNRYVDVIQKVTVKFNRITT